MLSHHSDTCREIIKLTTIPEVKVKFALTKAMKPHREAEV
jgi:hypothetical protein